MKKITIFTLLAICALSCQKGVQLSASIQNPNSDSLVIHNKDFKITLNGSKGKFEDNFEAPKGFYQLFDGAEFSKIYFSKGFDLKITADGKRFSETLIFSGKGSAENTYLLQKKREDFKLKESFKNTLPDDAQLQLVLRKRLADAKIQLASKKYEQDFPSLMLAEYEKENQEIISQLAVAKIKESSISALKDTQTDFELENINGGITKLSSLKGMIIYVDIWATWCRPCRDEIPYLKKLEEDFRGKPVKFINISIDEPKDRDKWKKFVFENNLKGIQLLADNAWKSQWIKDLKVTSIPRSIIIGKDGKIIDPDSPRPSSPEIASTLNKLLKLKKESK